MLKSGAADLAYCINMSHTSGSRDMNMLVVCMEYHGQVMQLSNL